MAAFDGHGAILQSVRRRGANPEIVSEMTARLALTISSLLLFAAVGAGAFGAHALKGRLGAELQAVWQTAVQYHFWHALGLLCVGVLMRVEPGRRALAAAAWLLLAGIALFSGSLYLMALSGMPALGVVTPIGGVALLAGWAALAWAVARR
jgi:uncharacterized membrane protein YgdD (TMEM256/DUF423 family)